jgi:hypothetical protein
MSTSKKLIKNCCEIDGCNVCDPALLELHHIIPRTEPGTSNHPTNLAILCGNCHTLVHSGKIVLIGVFSSTKLPNRRTLVYEVDGVRNIDIEIESPKPSVKRLSIRKKDA